MGTKQTRPGPRGPVSIITVGLLVGALTIGCGDKAKKTGPTDGGTAVKVDPKALGTDKPGVEKSGAGTPGAADAKARYVVVDAAKAAAGKKHFALCAACHGANGEGVTGLGARLASKTFLEAASDQFLVTTITKGRPGTAMVAQTSLKKEQMEEIIAFLRTGTKTEPAKLNNAPNVGDASKGEKTFKAICAACHGKTGKGFAEGGGGTAILNKAFTDAASDGYLRYIIANGKAGTAMRGFSGTTLSMANLGDVEIEDTIAYMRKAAK